jgi:RNA-binding protein
VVEDTGTPEPAGPDRELTGKQRRFLRGLGNPLRATVYVGKEGITAGILGSIEDAFNTGELIKIRVERNCPLDRRETGRQLADRTGASLVQILGQTVLLCRPDPEQPRLRLPR